jgi:hypothetical protein
MGSDRDHDVGVHRRRRKQLISLGKRVLPKPARIGERRSRHERRYDRCHHCNSKRPEAHRASSLKVVRREHGFLAVLRLQRNSATRFNAASLECLENAVILLCRGNVFLHDITWSVACLIKCAPEILS